MNTLMEARVLAATITGGVCGYGSALFLSSMPPVAGCITGICYVYGCYLFKVYKQFEHIKEELDPTMSLKDECIKLIKATAAIAAWVFASSAAAYSLCLLVNIPFKFTAALLFPWTTGFAVCLVVIPAYLIAVSLKMA